jgi:Lon protease-like protein
VLFSTLLDGDANIDQGLVSDDKPWKGTRRFGMAYYDQQAGGLASVGTVLEIREHSTMEDGRMLIENVGKERFKIKDVVEEKPILVCEVEYLEDEDSETQESEMSDLRDEVAQLFRDVVKLSTKLKDISDADPELLEPKELETLSSRDLSFWVASLFAGSPYNQQALLEENSSVKRLTVEKELLENTLKYLSAQSALQSLQFGGGDGEQE